jgi:hypothetical protein
MYTTDYNQLNNNIITYYSEATHNIRFTWKIN